MSDKAAESGADSDVLKALLDYFDHAMLVTRAPAGFLHARPMRIAGHEADGALYFATPVESGKTREVLEDSEVAATMQSGGVYLSVSGTGTLDTDIRKLDRMWSPLWREWLPDGDQHELTLIRLEPRFAEYWRDGATNRVDTVLEAARALLSGKHAPGSNVPDHGRLRWDSQDPV